MGTEERDADLSAASAVANGTLHDAGESDGRARPKGRPPVTVDEPPEPRRIRRQPDLMRLLFESMMIIVVLALGRIGVQTTSGLESDIHNGVQLAPSFLLSGITVLTNITTAVIPVGLAVERLFRRDGKRVADAVIAAALAYGVTSLLNLWIESSYAPHWLLTELTRHVNSGTTSPLHIYIATLIAFLTVLGFNDRPTLRTFTWVTIGIYAVATLMSGDSALVGLIVTFLLGRLIAFGWRYACGVVNERPTGQMVVQMLADADFEPVACSWQGEHEDVRRYEVRCADGRTLDVIVLDRDRQAVGLIYRVYRRIRLRGPAQRRNLFSLRRTVDQEALISYALRDAGIRTPKLVAVRELNADAALLAYEGVHAIPLSQVPADRFGDELLGKVWQTLKDLGRNQIAHRRLALDSILVDEAGEIWLTELRNGEVAAADLQQLLDIAEVMTALALKAGPERTVRVGAEILGEERLSAALPMLQPVVLTRTTRTAVRKSKHLLQRLREQILELRPHALVDAEPVKLERLSPKTLLTVGAACFAVYVLLFQLSAASKQGLNLDYVVHHTSPAWMVVAVAASALTYVSAAMVLTGFIPEKLPILHNLLVQVAAAFVSLVAPAAVGGVALNTRYMQKRGIATGPAVSAVGASQAVAFVVHIALIATFSFIAGQNMGKSDSSTLVIAILLAIALLVMAVMAIPPLRRFAKKRLSPFFADSLPRLLDVAQSPRKLAIALGGTISLSLFYALCLWASIHTVDPGNHISYATTAVVYLTAQTAGSFIPIPGGVGTVETAMTVVLKAVGVDYGTAVLAVLLFRLLCTYLPAIPGYFTFTWLTRKGLL
ncbi:flippase-like domain-containing protein [Actinospica sp. MGRD01-02]|uniref:Flippase-like domain-containing protein n=1 Tax=Actinospica acidithermotolerans TaxID=2828514 RepID=A0A941IJ33_9ACTN|nr:lysylphosphatidylglycerol synthase transmembrane domain-containing protein [Actinospica acidithermotolerans]MBR7829004.1 flippase-like domain-containing protein [Actinospica acidithermotolerans]